MERNDMQLVCELLITISFLLLPPIQQHHYLISFTTQLEPSPPPHHGYEHVNYTFFGLDKKKWKYHDTTFYIARSINRPERCRLLAGNE
jgi:hypothetical protein